MSLHQTDADDDRSVKTLIGARDDEPLPMVEALPSKQIPLSMSPGERPVAMLDARLNGDDPSEALAGSHLETRGRFSRVVFEAAHGAYAFGWIPTARIKRIATDGYIGPLDMTAPTSPWSEIGGERKDLTCAWNAPLVVDIEGVSRTVGKVLTGTPVEVLGSDGDFTTIRLSHLEAASSARFRVFNADLYPCRICTESP